MGGVEKGGVDQRILKGSDTWKMDGGRLTERIWQTISGGGVSRKEGELSTLSYQWSEK